MQKNLGKSQDVSKIGAQVKRQMYYIQSEGQTDNAK